MGKTKKCAMAVLLASLAWGVGSQAAAVELCTDDANYFMQKAGISRGKIEKLCKMVRQAGPPLILSL